MFKYSLGLICAVLSSSTLANDEQLEHYGDVAQIAIPASAAALSLMYGDMEGLMQVTEGAILTSAATHILKASIDEERPNKADFDAFPSGHTSAAVQGAAYLQFRYGSAYGVPAYAAAAVVGYSRVDSDHHYWHDVAAGALLATGIQYLVTKQHMGFLSYVVPYVDDEKVGIYANVRF